MIKRITDLSLVLAFFPAWFPLFLLIALVVRWRLGGPVLFRQKRAGRGGRIFVLRKFRTMREAYGSDGTPLPDDQRLTAFGAMLRSTSLDELPSLFNILGGSLSLVGPRPLLVDYLPLYSPREARRHEVPPGLTGWAQINGRNALTWREKFDLDVWYVEHRTWLLDLRILVLTLAKVLRRDGIAAPGEATMARFTGSENS